MQLFLNLDQHWAFSLHRTEHAKRSPNCGFLTMKKDFTELTVAEFFHMEKERLKVYIVSLIICQYLSCVQLLFHVYLFLFLEKGLS